MRKQIALGTVLALGVGAQAMAAEGLNYNYAQLGYAHAHLSLDGGEGSANLTGWSLNGSAAIGENFFAFGSFSDVSKSGGHLKPLTLGLGFRLPVSDAVDFVSGVSYEDLKVTGAGSDSGWGAGVGLRGLVGMVELDGNVKYVDYGNGGNGWALTAGARYNFTEALSAGADYTKWTGLSPLKLNQWGVNLRYSF